MTKEIKEKIAALKDIDDPNRLRVEMYHICRAISEYNISKAHNIEDEEGITIKSYGLTCKSEALEELALYILETTI